MVKELLLQRYFSEEVRGNLRFQSQILHKTWRRLLDERQSVNVMRFLGTIDRRPDISSGLKKLKCRKLIFVGDQSPFYSEAVHMAANMDRGYYALVEVQACGSVVIEEQPHAMLAPREYFLMGYGLYRPSCFVESPRSPLSPFEFALQKDKLWLSNGRYEIAGEEAASLRQVI